MVVREPSTPEGVGGLLGSSGEAAAEEEGLEPFAVEAMGFGGVLGVGI